MGCGLGERAAVQSRCPGDQGFLGLCDFKYSICLPAEAWTGLGFDLEMVAGFHCWVCGPSIVGAKSGGREMLRDV